MNIDLTQYVIAKWGPWFLDKAAFSPNELRLGSLQDGVTLAGPVRVSVSVQARNQFTLFGSSDVALQARDVYSYTLDIPPGQMWTYPAPRALTVAPPPATPVLSPAAPLLDATGAVITGAAPAVDATASSALEVAAAALLRREALWGANAGFGIAIRPAGSDVCADPCAPDPCRPVDPCAPRKKECHCGGGCASGCGCRGEEHGGDLPCDFATGSGSQLGRFFPAACEPCAPGAFIGMPAIKGPSLLVPPARGGTIRTRYFNGMFITKEDLWTDQNNNRIKHALMNRAMGQGVVWGLDVGLDGDAVCVHPGYAVDCCGNDIVISSAYRVDAAALVRDPAAAATLSKGKAQRMNLLLEYFECPEAPRPVHGDPCAPDMVSCEMSRIRETGRLRLVPPCEVDDSGPIKDFLDEVQTLKGDRVVREMLNDAIAAPTASATLGAATPSTDKVLQVVVNGPTSEGPKTFDADPSAPQTGVLVSLKLEEILSVTIQTTQAGSTILAGHVDLSAVGDVIPSLTARKDWTTPAPVNVPQLFSVKDWIVRAADGSEYSGVVTIQLLRPVNADRQRVGVTVATQESVRRPEVPPATQPPRFPCSAEACDPDGRLRFPVAIPWLHPDPQNPNAAADPKVIVLAILYAMSVSKIVQSGPGATDVVRNEQAAVASALNLAAWRLLYGNVAVNERVDLVEALRKLFVAWCKALLYPGPRCECGCDPHGVVVGCALVEGGTIRMVDPWGGRRWVVHYPLLAYWGKQFGIQPLDALASKFFDLICCVAHLYPSRNGTGLSTGTTTSPPTLERAGSAVVPMGASVLIFDDPANVAGRLAELGLAAARTETVGPTEFIAHVVEALHASAASVAPGATLVDYTVTGLPDMHFVTPAANGIFSVPIGVGPAPTPVPSPPGRPGTTRAVDMVRTALAARTAIPPLLRDVSVTLALDLLGTIAPEPITDAGRSVRDGLKTAGIVSVAGLLNARPEDLHLDVLNRQNAMGLAELLNVSEKRVAGVTKAVGDTMTKFAADRRIASRDDLAKPQIAADFANALSVALKGTVTADNLTAIVSRAAANLG